MVKVYMNISKNIVVSFDYTLTDDTNEVLDTSSGGEPLVYLHGHGNIIPGLDIALEGQAPGDSFKIRVPSAEAYGVRDEELVYSLPRDRFEGGEVEEGMQFQAQTPGGYRVVTVTKIEGENITIDGNHPLADMDLNFDITIRDLREAGEEEIAHGHIHHAHHHDGGGCCCGEDGCGGEGCGEGDCCHG
jgi:FKBP-type peptidyl-prolyl cis-trans isomerase SlyD